jgi:tripartite-type tricarboxylate transporter receptor subunit TctC
MKRRLLAATLTWAMLSGVGYAADVYPNKPIRLIVGFDAGGATDQVARIVSTEMSKTLGQTIIVENRSGAGSTIASSYVARAAPDGYMLLIGLSDLYRADKYMYPTSPFDGTKDFTPLSELASGAMMIVANKDLGISNVQELIARAKSTNKPMFYATAGTGRITHYAGLAFAQAAGIKLDPVAFKGGAPAVVSVVAGDTQLAFATPPSVAAMVRSGQLKALSVTSAERSPLFPTVPGIKESPVKGYDLSFWIGMFGPAGMPDAVSTKLHDAIKLALTRPDVQKKIASQGMTATPSPSTSAFADRFKKDGQETYELVKLSMEKK